MKYINKGLYRTELALNISRNVVFYTFYLMNILTAAAKLFTI